MSTSVVNSDSFFSSFFCEGVREELDVLFDVYNHLVFFLIYHSAVRYFNLRLCSILPNKLYSEDLNNREGSQGRREGIHILRGLE